MARPQKRGLDYFPFDVDFFQDEKIAAIAGEFGLKGEATAIHLLCAIYRNGYFIEWTEMLQMKMLRALPGVNAELLNSIVNRLVKWGFFDASLFSSSHVLTSRGIQKRYFAVARGRKKSAETPYLLVSDAENPVSDTETPVSDAETPQRKGNKRKVKENISSEDDMQGPLSAAPPQMSNKIDNEITILRQDAAWMEQLQLLHKTDKAAICASFAAFRAQCLADGKTGHTSVQDAKAHFNNWLRITLKQNNKQYDAKNKRNSYEIPEGSRKTYGGTF